MLFPATKFAPPCARKGNVARPHLTQLLRPESLRPFTLLIAPAGYGKTTLLSECKATLEAQTVVAWVALDGFDNDPDRFIAALGHSLAVTQATNQPATLDRGAPASDGSLRQRLAAFSNHVHTLTQSVILVLEDYHAIVAPNVHELLTELLDHQPRNLHLILTARSDPPLPIARWRVRGWVTEIREVDLRFTPAEVDDFLQRVMGLALTAPQLATLEAKAEGWAAALQIAALALQGGAKAERFIAEFSGSQRAVVDYLADEVIRSQPPEVRDFLLATSILSDLDAPLCEAVVPDVHAQAMLERLERARLFITALDEHRTWYRYHSLFADTLRHLLHRDQPDRESELHRQAAKWYACQAQIPEAVQHWLAAGAFTEAAECVASESRHMIWKRELWATLYKWLEALPQSVRAADARLALAMAWGLHNQKPFDPQVEHWLRLAERDLNHASNTAVLAEIEFLRLVQGYHRDQVAELETRGEHLLTVLPPEAQALRWQTLMHLTLMYRAHGHLRHGLHQIRPYLQHPELWHDYSMVTRELVYLFAKMEMEAGQLSAAESTLRRVLNTLARNGASRQLTSASGVTFSIALIEVLLMQDARSEAKDVLARLEALPPNFGVAEEAHNTLSAQLVIALAEHDTVRAAALVDDYDSAISQYLAHLSPAELLTTSSFAEIAFVALHLGQLQRAFAWADDYAAYRNPANRGPATIQDVIYARIRLAQGRLEEAEAMWKELCRALKGSEQFLLWLHTLVIQALLLAARNESLAALSALNHALALAAPEGYRQPIIEGGPVLHNLLRRGVREGRFEPRAAPFARDLLARLAPGDITRANAELLEPLSERELTVLRLMADDLSNREIAERLNITLDTVKKHGTHFFGKLGVSSRAAAVAHARELGLL